MKTTVDLPDEILHRAKMMAARRGTTLKQLIVDGLELRLRPEAESSNRQAALARVKQGFRLGGRPLSRHQAYERR